MRGRRLVIAVTTATILASCTDSASTTSTSMVEMNPCPNLPESLCPTQGTAQVEITGNRQASFVVPLFADEERSKVSLSLGRVQVYFRDAAVVPTNSLRLSGLSATLGAQQAALVVIVVGGEAYDQGTAECTVTLTSVDRFGAAGFFECRGLDPVGLEGTTLAIDATGSFAVSR